MNQKNKDLPAYPIKFNDQFGQLVILGGMTKLELVALELLKARTHGVPFDSDKQYEKYCIKCSYNMAENFCSFIENKFEQESKIIS